MLINSLNEMHGATIKKATGNLRFNHNGDRYVPHAFDLTRLHFFPDGWQEVVYSREGERERKVASM